MRLSYKFFKESLSERNSLFRMFDSKRRKLSNGPNWSNSDDAKAVCLTTGQPLCTNRIENKNFYRFWKVFFLFKFRLEFRHPRSHLIDKICFKPLSRTMYTMCITHGTNLNCQLVTFNLNDSNCRFHSFFQHGDRRMTSSINKVYWIKTVRPHGR